MLYGYILISTICKRAGNCPSTIWICIFHVRVRAGWLLRLAIDFKFIVSNADSLSEIIARSWGFADFDTPGITKMSAASDLEFPNVMRSSELAETYRQALIRVHATVADANMHFVTLFLEPARYLTASQKILLLESLLTALQASSGSARESFASSATAQGAGSEPAHLDRAENGPSQDGKKRNGVKRKSTGTQRNRYVHSITKEMAKAFHTDFHLLTKTPGGTNIDNCKFVHWFLQRAQAGVFGDKYKQMTEDDVPLVKSMYRSRARKEFASSRSSQIANGGPQAVQAADARPREVAQITTPIMQEPAAQNNPPGPTPPVTSSSDVDSTWVSLTGDTFCDLSADVEDAGGAISAADAEQHASGHGQVDRGRPAPDAAASSPGKRLKTSDANFKSGGGVEQRSGPDAFALGKEASAAAAVAGSAAALGMAFAERDSSSPTVSPISSLALGISFDVHQTSIIVSDLHAHKDTSSF